MRKAILLASAALIGAAAPHSGARSAQTPPAPAQASPAPAAVPAPAAPGVSDPFAGRPDQLPPALRYMQGNNVKMTSLGNEGGLRGYLLEEPNGKMQVVYLTPDGNSFVVGVMQSVAPDGQKLQNVTTLQFAAVRQRFSDARRRIEGDQRAAEEARHKADAAAVALVDQQRQIGEATRQFAGFDILGSEPRPAQPGSPQPAAMSPAPSLPVPAQVSAPLALPLPAAPAVAPDGRRTADDAARRAAAADAARAMSARSPATAERFSTALPKAGFFDDVERTSFTVGNDQSPILYMVVDPQCQHCHLAWAQLRPYVEAGVLTVKVVMIGALPGSEPLAIRMLSQPNPARSWWKDGQGSEPGIAIQGAPDGGENAAKAAGYVAANMEFVRKNGVTGTPWMAYVGKDGRVYKTEGDRDVIAFLGGL